MGIKKVLKILNLTILRYKTKLLISNEILPKSLQKLLIKNFGFIYIEFDSFKFTNNLTELNLIDSQFNDDLVKDLLPPSLPILKLSNSFNKPINLNSFPNNLNHLEFDHFNQKLSSNGFPTNLKSLIFGELNSKFNQITFLDFYCPNYEHIIDTPNILPSSLITFVRSNSIKHLITDNALPKTLKFIKY
ncbi:hypothetical protein ACTFIY_001957 [Dictyostelium cf. discoideum]